MRDCDYSRGFINFLGSSFGLAEHKIVFVATTKLVNLPLAEPEVPVYESRSRVIRRWMRQANQILVHGLGDMVVLRELALHTAFLKKSVWLIWGDDLYSYFRPRQRWKDTVVEFLRRRVIRNFRGIGAPCYGDYRLAKTLYRTRAVFHDYAYPNPIGAADLAKALANVKVANSEVRIQIGNSADPSNGHEELITVLARFRDRPIKVIAPLSYGDLDYGKRIAELGASVFGDKFVALTDYMSPEAYSEHLRTVDVLVFNHKRQQGMANISFLAALGAKIYLRSDISLWEFYRDQRGLRVFATQSIPEQSFEQFVAYTESDRAVTMMSARKFFENNFIKGLWADVFAGKSTGEIAS
jgi:hypothetical protein